MVLVGLGEYRDDLASLAVGGTTVGHDGGELAAGMV